jgi:hypothetical protein
VLHHAHRGEGQAIPARQPGPAVLALEEAGAEGRGELALALEIADAAEAEAVRGIDADGERVGVVEAEGLAHGQPRCDESGADRFGRAEGRVLQDDVRESARVLGIEVDGARGEGAIGETGAPQAELPLRARLAGPIDHLGRDLREDIALGE